MVPALFETRDERRTDPSKKRPDSNSPIKQRKRGITMKRIALVLLAALLIAPLATMATWARDYNESWPHTSLGGLAPQEYVAQLLAGDVLEEAA